MKKLELKEGDEIIFILDVEGKELKIQGVIEQVDEDASRLPYLILSNEGRQYWASEGEVFKLKAIGSKEKFYKLAVGVLLITSLILLFKTFF